MASLDAATTFDTSGVVNPIAGNFGWSLDAADQTLSLTYTPTAVPEPGDSRIVGHRRHRLGDVLAAVAKERPVGYPVRLTYRYPAICTATHGLP